MMRKGVVKLIVLLAGQQVNDDFAAGEEANQGLLQPHFPKNKHCDYIADEQARNITA